MVNIEIPRHCTISPSSFGGTPNLTINHDATVDLDSTNAFEGPEKLLEVWFATSPESLPACTAAEGLKAVPPQVWEEMLDLVNCKILSAVESEQVDAYLLSESSMFVFPHKLILKTCGTTTLLRGLPKILEIAALVAQFPRCLRSPVEDPSIVAAPYRVFYSRKNFLFPNRQRGPHRSWREEVKSLDKLFRGGSAYMIGKMNGEHWYLYLTQPNTMLTPPTTPDSGERAIKILEIPSAKSLVKEHAKEFGQGQDETLELMMTDLDPENTKQFYLDHASAVAEDRYSYKVHKACLDARQHLGEIGSTNIHKVGSDDGRLCDDSIDVFSNTSRDTPRYESDEELTFPQELSLEGHALGTVVSECSGLSDVYPASKYPDTRIDAYLFTPCGFSANGVVPSPNSGTSSHYFTVHVTPEPHCSYASFETNVPASQTGRETADVIQQVVGIFKPMRFTVTLFEAKAEPENEVSTAKNNPSKLETIPGYRRADRIVHDLEGYELVFKCYERYDWEGGAPRLGEVGF
ncbi:MAG: hypothetical protein LQ351_004253 [Letrouitia transgressa]|nr:MAG: hypothetical protein LQ351_004253 [Letrouitia transgressa]